MTEHGFRRPVWSRRRPADRGWQPPFSTRSSEDDIEGMFSVIVPLYNGSEFLGRAVESVLTQTYQNFEIIVVDDGSTDDSLDAARNLVSQDPRISVYAIDHSGGPARPRNYAIQRSNGEFIAFLDQDDWWLPEKLKRQLAVFEGGDDVVYSDAIYFDRSSPHHGSLVTDLPAHRHRFADVPGRLPEGDVRRHLIIGNFAAQLTVAIRAGWVRRVGMLDESAVGVDCYEYLLRLALAEASFGAVPEPLAVHDRGILSRDQGTARAHSLRFFKDLARRYPQFRELWTFRIREYEDVLIEERIERMRDGRPPLQRLEPFHDVLWLHPSDPQLRRAGKALLPQAVRRRVGSAVRGARIAAGR